MGNNITPPKQISRIDYNSLWRRFSDDEDSISKDKAILLFIEYFKLTHLPFEDKDEKYIKELLKEAEPFWFEKKVSHYRFKTVFKNVVASKGKENMLSDELVQYLNEPERLETKYKSVLESLDMILDVDLDKLKIEFGEESNDKITELKLDEIDVESKVAEKLKLLLLKPNIMVWGRAGSGKSTLINRVFGVEVAKTGVGRAVTDSMNLYQSKDLSVRLLDTPGLEHGKIDNNYLENEVKKGNIHCTWLIINASSNRVEQAELDFMRNNKFPHIVAITHSDLAQQNVVEKLKETILKEEINSIKGIFVVGFRNNPQLPKKCESCGSTDIGVRRALMKYICYKCKKEGSIPEVVDEIVELVEHTNRVIPENIKNSFAAAQNVSIKLKVSSSVGIIVAASGTAAGSSAAMVFPWSDLVFVATTQIAMVASLGAVWGLPLREYKTFVGSLALLQPVMLAGGWLAVTNLLKFVPGVGQVVGSCVSALLTIGLGIGYTVGFATVWKKSWNFETFEKYQDEIMKPDFIKDFLKSFDIQAICVDFLKELNSEDVRDSKINYGSLTKKANDFICKKAAINV